MESLDERPPRRRFKSTEEIDMLDSSCEDNCSECDKLWDGSDNSEDSPAEKINVRFIIVWKLLCGGGGAAQAAGARPAVLPGAVRARARARVRAAAAEPAGAQASPGRRHVPHGLQAGAAALEELEAAGAPPAADGRRDPHTRALLVPHRAMAFKNPEEMEAYLTVPGRMNLQSIANGSVVWAGVVLEDAKDPSSRQFCSDHLKTFGPTPGYHLEGFLAIQFLVTRAVTAYCFTEKAASFASELLPLLPPGEAMKIMGLPGALHWLAWFIKTIIFLLVSVVLIVVLLKAKWYPDSDMTVFTHSSGTLIFVFMLMFMVATTCFCFMISVFFSTANTAATMAGLAWFLTYAPYSFLQQKYETLSLAEKLLASVCSNTAMAHGFQLIVMFEGTGEGLRWDNVWQPATQDDNLTMGHILVMLLLDSLLYLVVTLYVEAVFPGSYGVPKPWYFPLQVFNKNKVAVDNLTLNMYEGQITVLLGHNGAGKTTTMSMLTGMYTPTSGSALVNGYDVVTDIDAARDSLGLCPQHNVLFDELTVREHLYFFGKLKGLTGKELEDEIQKYVRLLQLEPKEHAQSRTLSGGMKRKLAAGVALCGKSKVVMFDEPTSGMDPAARRALWDLLREEKAGRTLLLTTHFMDEADLLGDRIAIMAGGRLQCCGSPFFLKKRYGAGYRLVVVKGARCDAAAVTALLARHVAGLAPAQDVGSELSYQLDEEHAPRFEPMLRELEQQREALHVLSYGVSLTTMEEGRGPRAVRVKAAEAESQRPVLLTGPALKRHQVHAMLMKKALALSRGWVLFLVQCVLPVFFLSVAILIARTWQAMRDLPPRDIDLQSYSEVNTTLSMLNNDNKGIAHFISKYLSQKYKNVIEDNGFCPTVLEGKENTTGMFEEYILDQYRKDVSRTRHSFVVGASFDVVNSTPYITGWFNDLPYHSVPLTLNLLNNAILKMINMSITLVNSPLPYTSESQAIMLMNGNNMGFQIAFNIGFSMAFVAAYYIMFPIKERMSKAKHLQFVSGVDVLVFWIVNITCDGLSFLLPSLGVIITLAGFQEDGFATTEELGRIFVILVFFGWAMIPLMYLASYLFTIPASGYTRMTMFNIFAGIAAFMVVTILQIPDLDLKDVADILDWILLVVPHYCLADAIRYVYTNYASIRICKDFGPDCSVVEQSVCCPGKCPDTGCVEFSENYFRWKLPGIGRNIVFFLLMGCILNILLLLVEFHIFELMFPTRRRHQPKVVAVQSSDTPSLTSLPILPPSAQADLEDSDVMAEKERIRTSNVTELNNEFSLVLSFLAVDNISIGVKRGECFGLLGVNGAGKTTTFKMMTGDEKISEGDAFLNGLSIKYHMKKVHQLIGYCPQFDALIEEMTGRETLHMFCLLRGIPGYQIPRIVDELADELLFTKHIDKKVKEYSGGNKRKLSTAVALVGDPPVVFLDEPTTGMDPVAKRHLWNVICKVRDRGKSIILTSHSMEECEALCTRLAIMVNGNFKCLGSTQHLKSKFAEGYTLIIKVIGTRPLSVTSRTLSITSMSSLTQDINPVKNFIKHSFPGSILREEYMGFLTYYIPSSTFTWSQMFGMMERAKHDLNIEDYSLGQTSLEQVFLTFTKAQKSEMI
ncbi:Multidrug resistance protein homolog 49 [Gryllus bimaculatus]|nr:Multidrug resistance protein homolog 49 [Gryllus bimaculatus]